MDTKRMITPQEVERCLSQKSGRLRQIQKKSPRSGMYDGGKILLKFKGEKINKVLNIKDKSSKDLPVMNDHMDNNNK